MKRVFVHIGLHKTGTTSLQRFLYQNRGELGAEGVLYRCLDEEWPNHHPVAVGWRKGQTSDKVAHFLDDCLSSEHHHTVIFSSEMFAEEAFDVSGFLEVLAPHDVTVVAYLRNPCAQLVSVFNEVVRDQKVQWTHPIGSDPSPYDVSYHALLRDWLQAPRLILCPYDPPQWIGGTLEADFLATLGVDNVELAPLPFRENVSLPFSVVEIVRQANRAGLVEPDRSDLIRFLKAASFDPDLPARYPLSEVQCQTLIERLRACYSLYKPFMRDNFDESFLFEMPSALQFDSKHSDFLP
ncbi:hypothetical protein roselon_00950 [Roseibacterium elongatum DSM 19469]|uniref:Sulfotransferase domain-containing protein n=1 Tax=Roseicyclus elongatus DSM 19469 TaxID=1294273 RepID=W8SLD1_9RHOB|nr:hypothetical protein [Roseibacterium elongatum]AHM03350.1 hypothetical protein roselon_00950 [Roseibacterium elongatum DSM 19469]